MAVRGVLPSELLAFVADRSDKLGLRYLLYLGDVFLVGSLLMYTFPGHPFTEDGEHRWREIIDETRSEWEHQKLPDLMRFRDYFSFMRFARDEQVVVVVCGA